MSKKPASRYAQFRARQRGEVLKAGDALTAGATSRGSRVRIENLRTGKYLTASGERKKGGSE